LSTAAESFKGDADNWKYLLASAEGISVSFDLREALVVFAGTMPNDDATVSRLAKAIDGFGDSYDMREALTAFAIKGGWVALLDSVNGVSGSYDRSETLQAFAANMPENTEVLNKYRQVAAGIKGDHDREKAEKAIL
jgi:hypothetical protein